LHAGLRGSLDAELPPAAWRLHARDEIHGARQVVVVDEIGNAKEAAAVKGSASCSSARRTAWRWATWWPTPSSTRWSAARRPSS